VDQRADIFGIGAILYYLLCGKPPRDLPPGNASKVEIAQEQLGFDTLESSCNSAFAKEVCRRCLAPDPDNRFQSADELSKFLDSGPRTHRVQSAAVAGLAVLAFSIFGWLMISSSSQNTTYAVRQDFEITYQIEESDWRHFQSESMQDVELFQLGSTYEFKFKAVIPCYISVFSLECASGSLTLNNFERVYADFDKEIPAGSIYRKTIDPSPATPSGQTEFLWFVASSQPIDADAIGARITNELQLQWALDSDSASRLHFVRTKLANEFSHNNLNTQVASVRGVNKELGRQQISEGIIPYRAID
jgi:serine/threonine protein kinase